ncbi:hypothetical protein LCGC14_1708360 [marine sediment metagenome]|uniref:Uncharacterized protein n=1 Tax=marine sediment metagenome TaxID=412755 RepID=A0A0F9I3J7_9ZZZZ
MTRAEIQQQVDALAQQYLDRLRVAHEKRQAELQAQIDECERQRALIAKRLAILDS